MSLLGKSAEFYSSYDPLQIPGCAMWVDAADNETMSTNLSGTVVRVNTWRNKGSNPASFVRYNTVSSGLFSVSSTAYPILSNFPITGLPALYFGVHAGMELSGIILPPSYTAFGVASRQTSNGSYGYIFKVNNLSDNNGFFGCNPSNFFATFTGTPWRDVNGNTPFRPLTQTPQLMTSVTNPTNLIPYWNGMQMQSKLGNNATFNTCGIMIGDGSRRTWGQPWLGLIGEILIYSNQLPAYQRQEIEGYLTWKWKLTGTGVTNPFTGSTTFNPTNISATAWLDASDTSTITTATMSGQTLVATWTDKSASSRPTIWRTSNPRYDPITRSIILTGGSFLISGCDARKTTTPNFNMFMVYRFLEGGLSSEVRNSALWGTDQGGGNNRWHLLGFPAVPIISFAQQNGAAANSFRPCARMDTTEQILYSCCFSSNTTNGSFVRINGYQVNLSGTENAARPQTSMSSTSIGNLDEGNTYPARIAINEIIVCRVALTDASRTNVETYLANKWGISNYNQINEGHPYSNAPIFQRPVLPTDISAAEYWFDAADMSSIVRSGTALTTWYNKGSATGSHATVFSGTPTVLTAAQNGLNVVSLTPSSSVVQFKATFPSQPRTRFFAYRPTSSTVVTFEPSLLYQNRVAGSGNDNIIFNVSGVGEFAHGVALRLATSALANQSGTFSILTVRNSANATASNYIGSNGNTLTLTTSTLASYNTTADLSWYFNAREVGTNYNGTFDLGEFLSYNQELPDVQVRQIEGYLAWKWGLNTSLPSTHPYRNFYPLGGQFSPTIISNCNLWLDAADSTSMTFAPGTSNVYIWKDKSGVGTTIRAPLGFDASALGVCTLCNSAINGSPAIRFNRSGTPSNYFFSEMRFTGTAVTSFCVATTDVSATGASIRYLFAHGQLAPVDGSGIVVGQQANTINSLALIRGTNLVAPLKTITAGTIDAPNPMVVTALSDPTSTRILINGSGSDISATPASLGTINTSGTYIGAWELLGTNAWQGYIGEFITYTRSLTTWERQRVEGYLAGKWGLTTQLPKTHPYYQLMP